MMHRPQVTQGLFRLFRDNGALLCGSRITDQPLLQPEKPGGIGGDCEQAHDHRRDQRRSYEIFAGNGDAFFP